MSVNPSKVIQVERHHLGFNNLRDSVFIDSDFVRWPSSYFNS